MATFAYSVARGQYRNTETGRWVSETAVRSEIDRLADAASGQLAALTEQMRRGDLTLADWQSQAMATIKTSHVAAGVIAQGGRKSMDQATWGFTGQRIRAEYTYLRTFANGIADGTIPLDGRIAVRAGLYGQAARSTYSAVVARGAADRGAHSERNILSASESCSQCQAQSAMGWVPLGTLIPPGSRTCLANCKCRLTYSKVEALAA